MAPSYDSFRLDDAAERNEYLKSLLEAAKRPIYLFRPRPDQPEEFDEQTGFCNSQRKFSICLGGTGSGKTVAAAYKTAKYLLETPPPRPRCPFWIIGETYELVCSVCWDEKLSNLIPREEIAHVDWYKSAYNWPFSVALRHPDDDNEIGWLIEFKSYAQGRQRMQARSIGGYWFNEEVPLPIVQEVHGRCRDYDSPGWADFTPLKVESDQWREVYDDVPEGWEFFHLNAELNEALPEGWVDRYLATIPEDMRETRRIGTFSTFIGQVFKEFDRKLHVIEPFEIPADWHRIRGIDFGSANPFACMWVAKDRDDRYYVYREHFAAGQIAAWHAERIDHAEPWLRHNPHLGRTYSDHDAEWRAELNAPPLQERGIAISTTLAQKEVLRGIEALRRLMLPGPDGKPRFYVFDTCKNAIRELRSYHWPASIGKGEREKDPINQLPVPHDDHAIDAIRYAIYSDLLSTGLLPSPAKPAEKEWKREAAGRFLV